MSDDYDDDDDYRDAGDSSVVKELRKANRAQAKQLTELRERLEAANKSIRTRSVKDVLAAKGLPEKIAVFIPESATTSEDVEAWVAKYGDVFGVQAKDDEQQAPPGQQDQQPFDPQAAALARISGVQATGQPFSNDPDQLEALIKNAQDPEALNQILYGNKQGPPVPLSF